jgi:hypothetical protein
MRDPDALDQRITNFDLPSVGLHNPGADAAWFRERLRAEGIAPHAESYVARALRALDQMEEGMAGRWQPPPDEDQGDKIRSASGILFVIRALRRALDRRSNAFSSKWHLLRGPDVNLIAYRDRTQERDKIWELLVAALCARVFDDVTLADHENPDIRCSMRGEVWGIECKILCSAKPSAQQDHLLDKATQLEEAGISHGVIAVNMETIIEKRRVSIAPSAIVLG